MEFYDVIRKRRSIRQFLDREIPREALERILDAGLKAPSYNHQRRWELVVLTEKPVILELAQFIVRILAAFRSRKPRSRKCSKSLILASAAWWRRLRV